MSTDNQNQDEDKNLNRKLAAAVLAVLLLAAVAVVLYVPSDTEPAPTPPPEATPEPTETPTETETPTTEEPTELTTLTGEYFEASVEIANGEKVGWTITYTGNETLDASRMKMNVYDNKVHGTYTWQELSGDDTIENGNTVTVTESTIPGDEFDVKDREGGIFLVYDYGNDTPCDRVYGFGSANGALDILKDSFDCLN